ncbi:hypothetical protein BC831DRAFT_453625 [Entophlyctis helioformis]|nr:hypothetical protein BC831DRAFT_453625 [Entophlyctis helioformis]
MERNARHSAARAPAPTSASSSPAPTPAGPSRHATAAGTPSTARSAPALDSASYQQFLSQYINDSTTTATTADLRSTTAYHSHRSHGGHAQIQPDGAILHADGANHRNAHGSDTASQLHSDLLQYHNGDDLFDERDQPQLETDDDFQFMLSQLDPEGNTMRLPLPAAAMHGSASSRRTTTANGHDQHQQHQTFDEYDNNSGRDDQSQDNDDGQHNVALDQADLSQLDHDQDDDRFEDSMFKQHQQHQQQYYGSDRNQLWNHSSSPSQASINAGGHSNEAHSADRDGPAAGFARVEGITELDLSDLEDDLFREDRDLDSHAADAQTQEGREVDGVYGQDASHGESLYLAPDELPSSLAEGFTVARVGGQSVWNDLGDHHNSFSQWSPEQQQQEQEQQEQQQQVHSRLDMHQEFGAAAPLPFSDSGLHQATQPASRGTPANPAVLGAAAAAESGDPAHPVQLGLMRSSVSSHRSAGSSTSVARPIQSSISTAPSPPATLYAARAPVAGTITDPNASNRPVTTTAATTATTATTAAASDAFTPSQSGRKTSAPPAVGWTPMTAAGDARRNTPYSAYSTATSSAESLASQKHLHDMLTETRAECYSLRTLNERLLKSTKEYQQQLGALELERDRAVIDTRMQADLQIQRIQESERQNQQLMQDEIQRLKADLEAARSTTTQIQGIRASIQREKELDVLALKKELLVQKERQLQDLRNDMIGQRDALAKTYRAELDKVVESWRSKLDATQTQLNQAVVEKQALADALDAATAAAAALPRKNSSADFCQQFDQGLDERMAWKAKEAEFEYLKEQLLILFADESKELAGRVNGSGMAKDAQGFASSQSSNNSHGSRGSSSSNSNSNSSGGGNAHGRDQAKTAGPQLPNVHTATATASSRSRPNNSRSISTSAHVLEMCRAFVERTEQALVRLRVDASALTEQLHSQREGFQADLHRDREQLEFQHQRAMETLKRAHMAELAQQRVSFEANLSLLRSEADAMNSRQETRIQQLVRQAQHVRDQQQQQDSAQRQDRWNGRSSGGRGDTSNPVDNASVTLIELASRFPTQLASYRASLESEFASRTADAQAAHQRAMTSLVADHEQAIQDLQSRHQTDKQSLLDRHQADMMKVSKRLKDQCSTAYDSAISKLKNEYLRLEGELLARVTSEKELYVDRMERKLVLESEKARRERQVALAEVETKYQQQIADLEKLLADAKQQSLAELKGIKEKYVATVKRMRDELATTKQDSWSKLEAEWTRRRQTMNHEWLKRLESFKGHCESRHARCWCSDTLASLQQQCGSMDGGGQQNQRQQQDQRQQPDLARRQNEG